MSVTIESLVKQRKAQKRPAAARFFAWQLALVIAVIGILFMAPLAGGVFPEAKTLKSIAILSVPSLVGWLLFSIGAVSVMRKLHFEAVDREMANDWLLGEIGRLESASPGTFHPRVLREIACSITALEPLTVGGVVAIEQKVLSSLTPVASDFVDRFQQAGADVEAQPRT